MSQLPLRDLRVVDLSRILAGPFLTMQLADMGAQVVKVERPVTGDDTRGWGPPFAGGESAYFLALNRGKRSVTLDLKEARAHEVLARLLERADVLVENFGAAGRARVGLDLAALRRAYPRLVTCSITGFSPDDTENADRPGYDALIQAESGLMDLTGPADGGPTKVGVAVADVVAGQFALSSVLAALFARERGDAARHVDVSLLDSMVAALVNQAQAALLTGRRPRRLGNAHPHIVPYESFAASDEPFLLAVGNDAQFARLCEDVLAEPELAAEERYRANRGRVEHRADLVAHLARSFRARTAADWVARCRSAGIPAGRIRGVHEILAGADAAARGLRCSSEHAALGPLDLVGSPLRFDGARAGAPGAPPLLGQHNREVLEELGFGAEERAALAATGALGPEPFAGR